MIELSVIVPARNEMWLNKTVDDILQHSSEATEVIVVLDGKWPDEPLVQHPRLQVVYLPESIGQRAATNYGIKLSAAKYVMKVDAHVSMAQGFDRVLLDSAQELGDDVTQIPLQDNLHVFDWVCDTCGRRTYQGPTPVACAACNGQPHHRDVLWQRRRGVRTHSWRFDSDLKFAYWNDYGSRPGVKQGDYNDTLCCLGACWFLSRERYWHLGGMDELAGSWGQMGVEVACKSWLSGGRLVTNHKTTFAHLFRTAGGDFGFPYPIRGSEQEAARKYSRDVWLHNRWPQQVHTLRWLLEKFWPIPGWTEADKDALAMTLPTTVSLTSDSLAVGADTLTVGTFDDSTNVPSAARVAALPASILGMRDDVHVDRVDAVAPLAQVVDLSVDVEGNRSNEPRIREAMGAEPLVQEREATVSGVIQFTDPEPAARRSVNIDLTKEATYPPSSDVRDSEKLLVSHASASRADVGSGAATRSQRVDAPSIVTKSSTAGLVYYSDMRPEPWLLEGCRAQLLKAAPGMPLVSVTLNAPLENFGHNIVLEGQRGYLMMFQQMLAGLEALDTDYAFMVEQDILYSPSHFLFRPTDDKLYFYNTHRWKVHVESGRALKYPACSVSGLVANRELLVNHYRARVQRVAATGYTSRMGFEPGTHRRAEKIDDYWHATWMSEQPNLDLRHGKNLTPGHWSEERFQNQTKTRDAVPGWGHIGGRFRAFLDEHTAGVLAAV